MLCVISCNKEGTSNYQPLSDDTVQNPLGPQDADQVVYTLEASLIETKATIDEETGKFSWAVGDKIAVLDASSGTYKEFEAVSVSGDEGNKLNALFSFTGSAGCNFSNATAYYPSTMCSGSTVTIPEHIASLDEAPLSATRSGDGALAFNYVGAVMKLVINNVPSFATSLVMTNGGTTRTVSISHATNENMSFYLVIPAGTYTSASIALSDGDEDIILKHFSFAESVAVGDFIPMNAINIKPVLLIKNNTGWGNLDITLSNATLAEASFKTVTIGGKQHYYIVSPSSTLDLKTGITVAKKDNSFPSMYDKSIALDEQEVVYVADLDDGIRKLGATTKRVHVEMLLGSTNDSMYDSFVHVWGTTKDNTTWENNDDSSRKLIESGSGSVTLGAKGKGYVNEGNAAGKELMIYFDLDSSTSTFNIRLHNADNEGGELESQTATTTSRYAFYNRVLRRYSYQMNAWDNIFGIANPDPYSCPSEGFEVCLYNNAGYWVGEEKLHVYGSPNWKDYNNSVVDYTPNSWGGKSYCTWFLDKGTSTSTQTILFFKDDGNQAKADGARPVVNFGSDWEKGIINLN